MIAIIAHQRRKVEGGRQTGLPSIQQRPKPFIRLLGRSETSKHSHRPEPAAVHRRLYSSCKRVLPGIAEFFLWIEVRQVLVGVDGFYFDIGQRLKRVVSLRMPFSHWTINFLIPTPFRLHALCIIASGTACKYLGLGVLSRSTLLRLQKG